MSKKFFPWSLKWTAIHLSGPYKLKLSWRRHTRQMKEGGDPPPSPFHTNPQVWLCHVKGADLLPICSIAAFTWFFFCIHCFNFSGKSSTPCVPFRKYKCKPLYCSNVVIIFIFIFLIICSYYCNYYLLFIIIIIFKAVL